MILKRKANSIQMEYTLRAMRSMVEKAGLAFSVEEGGKLNYLAIRKTMESGYANYPVAEGVSFEDVNICSTHMEVAIPSSLKDKKNIIFYIHGGGFCCGSAKLSRGIASQLALDLGCKVFSVDYRLCPENKFPLGVNDCYTGYKALAQKYTDARIAVMGESAGANLSLVVTLLALQEKIKIPCCVVPNSPIVSFMPLDRRKEGWDDLVIGINALSAFEDFYYTEGTLLSDFRLSPIYGNFNGFPPTVITCDEHETLSVDAYLLHDALEKEGVDVTLVSVEGAFHAFGATGKGTPESAYVLDMSEKKIIECFNK